MAKRNGGRTTAPQHVGRRPPQSRHSRWVRMVAIAALFFLVLSLVMVLIASEAMASCGCDPDSSGEAVDFEGLASAHVADRLDVETWEFDILEARSGPYDASDLVVAHIKPQGPCGLDVSLAVADRVHVVGEIHGGELLVDACTGSLTQLDVDRAAAAADADDGSGGGGTPWSMIGLGIAVIAMLPAWRASQGLRKRALFR